MNASRRHAQQGLTILEVMLAMAIFAACVVGIQRVMTAGDRVRGRGIQVAAATQMASNEIQRVRATAARLEVIHDTTYAQVHDGVFLELHRRVLNVDPWVREQSFESVEIQLDVYNNNDERVVALRMLQGYDR